MIEQNLANLCCDTKKLAIDIFFFGLMLFMKGEYMLSQKSEEEKLCTTIINLKDYEAIRMIRNRGFVDRIIWENGKDIPKSDGCYISHRINLKIRNGKVVSAIVG